MRTCRRTTGLLVLSTLAMTLGFGEVAWASCSGDACRDKDPSTEGCTSGAWDGETKDDHPGWWDSSWEVRVVVRKSRSCGNVKWAKAWQDTSCGLSSMSVWLEDDSGHVLTRYDNTTPWSQIYSNMWTGPVKACVHGCGKTICTDLDF